MSSTIAPSFRCSTVFSEFESLHLFNQTSLTDAREPPSFLGVASPRPATLTRSTESSNKRTRTRTKHVFAALAAVTSSFLRRKHSNPLQNNYQTTLDNLSTSTVSSYAYNKPQFTPVQLQTPNMSLISLEEAARRPGLTKELYLVDKLCARSYTTSELEQRFPHTTLISLEEVATRPELTKRVLFH